MPQVVSTIDVLQRYIRGVIGNAEHHAGNVDEICLAVAGAVMWRKDADFEVMTRGNHMTNVLWVRINGQRYALAYNHDQRCIEVRRRSTQGQVVASFTNASTVGQVKQFFASL